MHNPGILSNQFLSGKNRHRLTSARYFGIVRVFYPIFGSLSTQVEEMRQLFLLVRQLSGLYHDCLI